MTSATIGNSAIDSAILGVVRETIADEAEVQFVAKLLRQVFVDGKAVADVTEGRCVSTDRVEAFVYEIEQVLATAAVEVKKEVDIKEEVDEPTSEMDLPPQSDDELSLELGLENTDATAGSSAAIHSPSDGRLQQKPQSFGKAVFTPDGCIVVESERYPGVTLQFRVFESRRGRKSALGASYHCSAYARGLAPGLSHRKKEQNVLWTTVLNIFCSAVGRTDRQPACGAACGDAARAAISRPFY